MVSLSSSPVGTHLCDASLPPGWSLDQDAFGFYWGLFFFSFLFFQQFLEPPKSVEVTEGGATFLCQSSLGRTQPPETKAEGEVTFKELFVKFILSKYKLFL